MRVDAIFQRQVVGEVMVHDGDGLIGFGPADANLDVETPRSQHSRIDHVHAVGSTDYHHIVECLHAVEFGEELGHNRGLHIGGDAGAAGA